MATWISRCFTVSVVVSVAVSAYGEPPGDVLDRIQKHIPKLTHANTGRLPLLIWETPDLPTGIDDNTIQQTQAVYLDRGLLPLCNRCGSPARAKEYLPIFQYWQERGVPVCLLPQGWVQTVFLNVPNHAANAGEQPPAPTEFHCPARMLAMARDTKQGTLITQTLSFLKEEGIDVKLIVADFESGLFLRNKQEEELHVKQAAARAAACPDCIAAFGAESLAGAQKFAKVADQVRSDVTRQILTEPSRSVFPDVAIGNFYAWPISRTPPVRGRYPAYGYEQSGLNVMMPRMYINAGWGGAGRDQALMNWNAFYYFLEALSPAAEVKQPGELLIPWTHIYVGSTYLKLEMEKRALPDQWVMAEMARHMILRGAETFAVYCDSAVGKFPPDYPHSRRAEMGQLVVNLQGLQEGYNDMLAFQDFLRDARPMTFNVTGKPNTLNAATAIWSGAASETRALVRTVNFQQGKPITKRVNAFGKGFSLQFGPRGRSWWLTPDGKIEEIVNKSKQ